MNINKKIAEVLARSDKATIGPWGINVHNGLTGGLGKDIIHASYFDDTIWFDRQEDADFVTNSRLDLPALAHAIDAVLDLHEPKLDTNYESLGKLSQYCDHCNNTYPCPTIRALDKGFRRSAVYALMDFDRENGITE